MVWITRVYIGALVEHFRYSSAAAQRRDLPRLRRLYPSGRIVT